MGKVHHSDNWATLGKMPSVDFKDLCCTCPQSLRFSLADISPVPTLVASIAATASWRCFSSCSRRLSYASRARRASFQDPSARRRLGLHGG